MLRSGDASLDMDFFDLQRVCKEPALHEFDDLGEMLGFWELAKMEYRRELMPLKVSARKAKEK